MSRFEQDHRELDFNNVTGFGRRVSYAFAFEGEGLGEDFDSTDFSDYLEGLN